MSIESLLEFKPQDSKEGLSRGTLVTESQIAFVQVSKMFRTQSVTNAAVDCPALPVAHQRLLDKSNRRTLCERFVLTVLTYCACAARSSLICHGSHPAPHTSHSTTTMTRLWLGRGVVTFHAALPRRCVRVLLLLEILAPPRGPSTTGPQRTRSSESAPGRIQAVSRPTLAIEPAIAHLKP